MAQTRKYAGLRPCRILQGYSHLMVFVPFPFFMLEVLPSQSLPISRQFPSSHLAAFSPFIRSRYSKSFPCDVLRTALQAYLWFLLGIRPRLLRRVGGGEEVGGGGGTVRCTLGRGRG